jgi:hypothetical protein
MDTPLGAAFKTVAALTLYIEAETDTSSHCGTAYPVAYLERSGIWVVATAAHLLRPLDDQSVTFRLLRTTEMQNLHPVASFTYQAGTADPKLWHYHNDFDIGIVFLPREVAGDLGLADQPKLRVVALNQGVTPATRVAWCGFPGAATAIYDRPILAYFEGSVSASLQLPNHREYIIDGHASRGVSGGPVYHISDKDGQPELIAVISKYMPTGNHGFAGPLPGYLRAVPINYVRGYLQTLYAKTTG